MVSLKEIGSSILLFFLVFGMSATVDIGHVWKQLRNRNALLTGISLQFLILPFVGFIIVRLLDMDAPLGITLLVVTSSPGGSYSNWYDRSINRVHRCVCWVVVCCMSGCMDLRPGAWLH